MSTIVLQFITTKFLGGGLLIGNLNDVRGSLWNQTPYIHEFHGRKKNCIHSNGLLGDDSCIYILRFSIECDKCIHYNTKWKSWFKLAFIKNQNRSHFPMRKSLNKFSSIACNSTIASNKQRLEHNNSRNPESTHEDSKSLKFIKPKTQMQIPKRINMVIIKDYYHK